MNFFKRLFLKLRKKVESKTQDPSPPITISPPPPVEIPKEVKYTESVVFTAVEVDYLTRYPDVAAHRPAKAGDIDYSKHPYQHYIDHGKKEGRTWGIVTKVPEPLPTYAPTVTSPGGRVFPAPSPGENAMDYIGKVGIYIGRGEDWRRISGTLFLGVNHLVPKNVKYPDDYASWIENPANWPTLAENQWFPTSVGQDTEGWKKWEETVKNRTPEPAPVKPSVPPGEELL